MRTPITRWKIRNQSTIAIGIAGPSCAGKSTLATALVARLGNATTLSLDDYYHCQSRLPPHQLERQDFDRPEAIDNALIIKHIRSLLDGQSVQRPSYDFATHSRSKHPEQVLPHRIVVLEGLHTFHWRALRELLHLRVYLTLDPVQALTRRLIRDTTERSREHNDVVRQYELQTLPAALKFVEPTRRHAHLVLDGTQSPSQLAEAIMERLPSSLVSPILPYCAPFSYAGQP